jgi:hypothetical protein
MTPFEKFAKTLFDDDMLSGRFADVSYKNDIVNEYYFIWTAAWNRFIEEQRKFLLDPDMSSQEYIGELTSSEELIARAANSRSFYGQRSV